VIAIAQCVFRASADSAGEWPTSCIVGELRAGMSTG
jgi:hypothetical protein